MPGAFYALNPGLLIYEVLYRKYGLFFGFSGLADK